MEGQRFFPAIVFGVITIFLIIIAASFILSLLVSFTSLTEQSLQWVVITTAFVAMFIGGFIAGGKAKEKGLIVGGAAAFFFTVLTFLIQFLGYDQSFTLEQYLYHAGYIFTAMIGGIVGVNLVSNS